MDNTQNINTLTFGSLFSGAGGLDMGLERAGFKCTFQVENDKNCINVLAKHWPNVPKNEIRPCDGLVGGDPCPIRSSLSSTSGTSKPDLSGYFLAMVARIEPRWVLRENVVAPDVMEFKAGMEVLGYHCIVIEANSAAFTNQSRNRQFMAGFRENAAIQRFSSIFAEKDLEDFGALCLPKQKTSQCLNTRGRGGVSIYQDFIYEPTIGEMRSHTHAERESLQGWPIGWTDGISNAGRERMTGNGVTSLVAEYIGKILLESLWDQGI